MRILGLDFETTGLDPEKDRIIEIGAVLWETEGNHVIHGFGNYIFDDTYPELSGEITALTGIHQSTLREFGKHPFNTFKSLNDYALGSQVKYICAHNGELFDKPFLANELKRSGLSSALLETPWLDTRADLPFRTEPDSRKLKHLALDQGFINPFPHRAQYDVLTMMKVLSQFKIEDVIEYSKIPWVTIRALVEYKDRQLAKDKRYYWETLGDKKYKGCWVKKVKENYLETERKQSGFEIVVL